MNRDEKLFSVWLSLCVGIANTEFVSLLEQFGSAYALFRAEEAEIEALDISDSLKGKLCNKSLDEAYGILDFCQKHGVGILCYTDCAYPSVLRAIKAPPCVLYYKGKLPDFERQLFISMVGTRSMSEYGKEMAYRIAYELASTGVVVVSGMALGVDAACAVGALSANGCTVAVLGCGIDVPYPRQHERLMHAIEQKGLVITEFPPSTPPRGYHFPLRNRIISGLGAGTLVVEADLGSGALITAREAIVQGKDIYAVPGNVTDPNTSGTNALIRDGAAVALGARDILQNYAFLYRDSVDTARLMRAQERSDPDPAAFARYGVGLPAASAPAKSASEVRREQSLEKQEMQKKKKPEKAPKAETAKQPVPQERQDDSAKVLEAFSQRQRDMFAQIPLDKAISADWLVRCGYPTHEVMTALTMFEIKGLLQSLPGGLYTRK
ncbi:MAG: DNA-processing protein DprA [Clostridia bacterium]|nr:DNA-processing protein DprA [Clostridia bacterium]